MMEHKLTYRYVDRNCYCRICNKDIPRNSEKAITFYSLARRGGIDIICKQCVELVHGMVTEEE